MSIPGSAAPFLLAQPPSGEYQIERSLRFNSTDSAYLSRTPASAGNRKTWTWSGWVKRSQLGGTQRFFIGGVAGAGGGIQFTSDTLVAFDFPGSFIWTIQTSAVFRDVSAWYHILLAVDTTQATSSNRVKLYVNGTQQTAITATYPALNYEGYVNAASTIHTISSLNGSLDFFNGYLADIHFIDGQALDPTSFGEFDDNGVWQPIKYVGSHGTNGFYLPFSNNSNASALGTDASGNNNNWNVNNISVAAGASNDSLVDSPTNYGTDTGAGGQVRGNYCTWNPLRLGTGQTLTNGNLDIAGTGNGITLGTIYVSTGKWYYEAAGGVTSIGIATNACPAVFGTIGTNVFYHYNTAGLKYDGSTSSGYGASFGVGDVIGVAFDLDAGTLAFYKNGVSQGTAFTGVTGLFAPAILTNEATARSYNFGQRPFAYAAPSGYKALCTANLDEPVVAQPSTVMDVKLYTGNGSTQTISGLGFSPDFVWTKARSFAENNNVFDTVRGATKLLLPDQTNFEQNISGITAFNSDGYTVGSHIACNSNGQTYVSWNWDAGSSTVTNTDGSITSQVRANASAGFSIVTYTGDRTSAGNSTIGHGLGVAPSLVITKSRSNSSRWVVQHVSLGSDDYLSLNTTDAVADSVAVGAGALPKPTSTVFYGSWLQGLNNNGETFVAYCFAPVAGYSAFGSYTGNGSALGSMIYTGMRPRWIMIKRTDAASTYGWWVWDTERNPYNASATTLLANTSGSELVNSATVIDILSNGFIPNGTGTSFVNLSGATYIYAAFAENPFKYARAR